MGCGGGWAAGGMLYPPLGPFGPAMVQEMPAIGPNILRESKRCLTTAGVNFRPMSSMLFPPWVNCLSHEFIWLTKLALEK